MKTWNDLDLKDLAEKAPNEWDLVIGKLKDGGAILVSCKKDNTDLYVCLDSRKIDVIRLPG